MKRLFCTWLLLLFTVALFAEPTRAERKADKLLKKAAQARVEGNHTSALKFFNRAVREAPEYARPRLERGEFLLTILSGLANNKVEKVLAVIRADFQMVAHLDRNGPQGGVARDALRSLSGNNWFPQNVVACSEAGGLAYNEAERLFQAQSFEQSFAAYRQATELCPEQSLLWIHYGHAYALSGRPNLAKGLFHKGLDLDPWAKSGHRFLAGVHWSKNEGLAAHREAVLAVISDPFYEAGWNDLRLYTESLKGQYRRVFGDKSKVIQKYGVKTNDSMFFIAEDEMQGLNSEAMAWLIYGASHFVGPHVSNPGAPVTNLDPIDRELAAVKMALDSFQGQKSPTNREPPTDSFWAMMSRAEEAGYLREAIFMHLLDEDMVSTFKAFREQNTDRMVAYVNQILVPLPNPNSPLLTD